MIDQVDHLVYATHDLDASCTDLEQRLGVRASVGGQHRGRGTHNALLAIGPACYLEIIGPDPAQPTPPTPRWFGVDALTAPRLVTWAAHGSDLPRMVKNAGQRGASLGKVSDGRRERADGVILTWQVTDPDVMLGDGLVPFFIDWGASPHPSSTATVGPRLIDLRGEHPDPTRAREALAALDLPLTIAAADRPSLVATLDTPNGLVELR